MLEERSDSSRSEPPLPAAQGEVTRLLLAWSDGDREALGRLMPLVFEELRGMAQRYFGREDSRHTLQPTALVNEVYLRLIDRRRVSWRNHAHFFGFAAELMRNVLVDHARTRQAGKRNHGERPLSIEVLFDLPEHRDVEVLQVHEALTSLARVDKRQARIVVLRFFGGLDNGEIGAVLGISHSTVKREWKTARLWLLRELSRG